MRTLSLSILVVSLLVVFAPAAAAETGYENDHFTVRLASAFIRYTEVSAFGGETAANRWSPAVNPASTDWTRLDTRHGVAAAGYWSHIDFDVGTEFDIYGETAVWDTRKFGTVNVALSQLRSNDAPDANGRVFDYETDVYLIQWGKRFGNWAAGLTFNYADTTYAMSVGGQPFASAEAKTYRFRVGGLWEPCRCWLVGLVAEYATSPYDFEATLMTPFGPLHVEESMTMEHAIGRIGVSYLFEEYSAVYADYQFAWFSNEFDDLEVHRFSAGVQKNLARFLFLRVAGTIDDNGNPGLMTGIGMAFARWISIDFGYHMGTLPELRSEFGDSETLQLTVAVRF